MAEVYDFARRPLWILSHVLVILGVLVMIRLGFWQLDRWHEEQDAIERIEAGLQAEPVPLDEVLPNGLATDEADESLRYRRVTVGGTWDTDSEVVVRNRSQQSRPGGWLLTPLVQDDGTAIAVVRGWVPLDVANAGRPFEGAAPPPGEAVVLGVVGLTQPGGGIGPQDPAEGNLESFARVDLDRLAKQIETPLEAVWLTLEGSEPPQDVGLAPEDVVLAPVVVDLPSPSQNLSYMGQWWMFAAIASGGYILILRKLARGRAGSSRSSVIPYEDDPEPVDV